MSSPDDVSSEFLNYPMPIAHEASYTAAPPAKNPVIKGATLHYVGNLFVPQELFSHSYSHL
jgi:hypothetical protein